MSDRILSPEDIEPLEIGFQQRYEQLLAAQKTFSSEHLKSRLLVSTLEGEQAIEPLLWERRSRIKRLTWLLASAMGIGLALMGYRGF